MTANHEHTPTTEEVRCAYSVPWHEPENHSGTDAAKEFNRWHRAELAAAEQCGKERAWVEGVLYAHERHNNHAGLSPSWKFDNPYRADQMEVDDGGCCEDHSDRR